MKIFSVIIPFMQPFLMSSFEPIHLFLFMQYILLVAQSNSLLGACVNTILILHGEWWLTVIQRYPAAHGKKLVFLFRRYSSLVFAEKRNSLSCRTTVLSGYLILWLLFFSVLSLSQVVHLIEWTYHWLLSLNRLWAAIFTLA
jgi:hypothetical protein